MLTERGATVWEATAKATGKKISLVIFFFCAAKLLNENNVAVVWATTQRSRNEQPYSNTLTAPSLAALDVFLALGERSLRGSRAANFNSFE